MIERIEYVIINISATKRRLEQRIVAEEDIT